eukprot:634856_1
MTDHDNEQKHHSIKSSTTTKSSSTNNEFPSKPSTFDPIKFSANRPLLSNVNPHKNDKITYKTPVQPTDKHFVITSLFSNIMYAETLTIFADLKSKSIESFDDLKSAKEVDLQTGYPILSWFLDMYSRDRIAKAVEFDYDINRWFYDNLYARYVLSTHREVAQKLKQGMTALCKHVLPPIELHNIRYNIEDKLNGVARYIIASHQLIQSVIDDQSIDEQWQPIFPIQIDVKIIPRQVKHSRSGSFENNLTQQLFYHEHQDYFKEIASRASVEDLAQQFKRMWKDKGAGKKDSHQRYLFVIDRRMNKDTIYLIKPRGQPWPTICDEYYHICESLLYTSQKDDTLGSLNDYSLSLTYHLFQVDYVKSYCHFGVNGAALFELNDMIWLWGKYFQQINGQPQRLNEEYLNLVKNTKKLPNIQFDEFSKQSHDESNEEMDLLSLLTHLFYVFGIKDLIFAPKRKDVAYATKYVQTECPAIFIHPNLAAEPPLEPNPHKEANKNEDKSMCITKAVDFKNGYPILKWFCDTFCRDRIHGHQTIYETYAVPFYKYKYHQDKYAAGYNATAWWLHDSPYCKYIQHKHAPMALPMMTAVQAFCKRILPPLNFDWSAGNIIHDNLNSFAEYTMACYGFVHELTQNEAQAMPFQLDFCIIPQLATPVSYDKDGKLRFNRMGIWNKATKEVAHPIWRITELLKQAHYAQDRDFVCEDAQDTVSKLQKQLYQMWKTLRADLGKYRRYVLVIDRRNPKNLDEKDMAHEPPRYWKQTKDWTDRIYLIAPKCAHEMSMEVRSIQELFFAYSKQYLLPHIGRNIGINDALNGYKFALSFHILDQDTSSVYFYHNSGGVKFELTDIEWLWVRFFNKFSRGVQGDRVTRHGEQKLSDRNKKLLKKYYRTKRLVDAKFDEFWKQSHAIRIIHRS